MTERVRLQKFLARVGVASRRASEVLIRAGRVRVDGEVAEIGSTIDPAQCRVTVDDQLVTAPGERWIMLHKPPGVLCSRGDPQGRDTVYDLLPREASPLFHVGRLDYMSEGLLLLSNAGDVSSRLLHPSLELPRTYRVTVAGPVPEGLTSSLVRGIELEDGLARAATCTVESGGRRDQVVLVLELREGRNRVVRRMMDALGLTVHSLCRISFGPLRLGDLPRGEHRELSQPEIRLLRGLAGAEPISS